MGNRLPSGGVLPSSMLKRDFKTQAGAFNKKFNNTPLRAGIVIASYPIDSDKNIGKLTPEYDVLVMEQDGDQSMTPLTYKNCITADGLGSIADYFEKALRPQKKAKDKVAAKSYKNQDGAIVILLCLDGASEKAVIIGAAPHPDRKTKLNGKTVLAGEMNGISISIADDGSANLTFKGATNNDGTQVDSSQGNTTIDIEKDGSLQIKNAGVTKRLEKAGNVLLELTGVLNVKAQKEAHITAKAADLTTTEGDISLTSAQRIAMEATGSASLKAQEGLIDIQSSLSIAAQAITAEAVNVNIASILTTVTGFVVLGGAGAPALNILSRQFGIGALGVPVVSSSFAGFSRKVIIA